MRFKIICAATLLLLLATKVTAVDFAVVRTEFVFESAPFASCHASTIAETRGGQLLTAFFAGSDEGRADVGIWVSRFADGRWTPPIEATKGESSDRKRQPCWNPVLFQPKKGPLLLFYKVGPSPNRWWGMMRTSDDEGKTWSEARRLPDGILGPIKDKPVQLAGGDLVCPSSTEDNGWQIHFERTSDLGQTWTRTKPLNDGRKIAAIQPTIVFRGPIGGDKLLAMGRTKQGHIFRIASDDGGKSWGEISLMDLPNPNSGIDAITLSDGRQLLVYNHSDRDRSPLNVALSSDGDHWQAASVLENVPESEFSYPAVIQARDGLVHCTYTWNRKRIRHIVLDPSKLTGKNLDRGQSP
jgi:predicted neuraminidase